MLSTGAGNGSAARLTLAAYRFSELEPEIHQLRLGPLASPRVQPGEYDAHAVLPLVAGEPRAHELARGQHEQVGAVRLLVYARLLHEVLVRREQRLRWKRCHVERSGEVHAVQ